MPDSAAVLRAADPSALLMRTLRQDAVLQVALGAPGLVGGSNAPPYPRLLATDQPGGLIRPSAWLVTTEYLLEVYGDPDGTQGRAFLRPIMLAAIGVLLDLPYAPTLPGEPVVTQVEAFGTGGYSPVATGQKRYIGTVTVTSHPSALVVGA